MSSETIQPQRDPGDAWPWKAKGKLASILPGNDGEWYGWVNVMPAGPHSVHVVGTIAVANPGVDVVLLQRIPSGINPTILQLTLSFVQLPGIWPDVVVLKQARFDKVLAPNAIRPESAEIFEENISIAKIDSLPVIQ